MGYPRLPKVTVRIAGLGWQRNMQCRYGWAQNLLESQMRRTAYYTISADVENGKDERKCGNEMRVGARKKSNKKMQWRALDSPALAYIQ
jgi:hypothetical protein